VCIFSAGLCNLKYRMAALRKITAYWEANLTGLKLSSFSAPFQMKLIERKRIGNFFMRTLNTIALILVLFWGHDNFAHSSVYPMESDWDSPLVHGAFIESYDIGVEIIKIGDTPLATITTIQQHEYGSLLNYSNSGQILVTHNSFLVNVTKGKISLQFYAHDGTIVTLAAGAGNSYEFEPKSFTTTSAVTNSNRVLVAFDEVQYFVPPGESTQIVDIDIMPAKKFYYPNQNAKGLIPVVIFGSMYLDVNNIEISSLNFESLAVKTEGGAYYLASVDHVNNDKFPDLVVLFEADDTFLSNGFSEATLKGNLFNGTIINGKNNIYMVH